MWTFRPRMTLCLLAAIGIAGYQSAASADILQTEASLKYVNTQSNSAGGSWKNVNDVQIAEMKATYPGEAAGFFVVTKGDKRLRAWDVSFLFKPSGCDFGDLAPYLHLYSKRARIKKYDKDLIIPNDKLKVVDADDGWKRATWGCKGCMAPDEGWTKWVVVLKPKNAVKGGTKMLLKRFLPNGYDQVSSFNLKVEPLGDSPDNEFK
jgi:hypothetical protein